MSIPKAAELKEWQIPEASGVKDPEFDIKKVASKHDEFLKCQHIVNSAKQMLDAYESPIAIKARSRADYYKRIQDPEYLGNKIEKYSNAWLKMFEMLVYFHKIGKMDKINETMAADPSGHICTVHIAELPGSMICATRHWLWQTYKTISHDWYGESWVDPNSSALGDTYGLIAKHPERWLIGQEDGLNGDLSDPRQVEYIERRVLTFKRKPLIVSGDLGIDASINYDEEETLNQCSQFGQDITCLLILDIGGLMIAKHYLVTSDFTVSWVALLSTFFDAFYLCKPATSRSRNSEIYFVGTGYRGISTNMREKLLEKLASMKRMNMADPMYSNALLTDDEIGSRTLNSICDVSRHRAMSQKIYLQFIVRYTKEKLDRNNKDNSHGSDNKLSTLCVEAIENWLKTNHVESIPHNMRVL
jgi:hypothetical protein